MFQFRSFPFPPNQLNQLESNCSEISTLMLARGVEERLVSGKGRAIVATQDLSAGSLVLVSPALAVSSTSNKACAFCFTTLDPDEDARAHDREDGCTVIPKSPGRCNGCITRLECSGGCGLVWCSEACRSSHAIGYNENEFPLLRAAPHGAMCVALKMCSGDGDARLLLEVLLRGSGTAEGQTAVSLTARVHTRFIFMAAGLLYSQSITASSEPAGVHANQLLQQTMEDLRNVNLDQCLSTDPVSEMHELVSHHTTWRSSGRRHDDLHTSVDRVVHAAHEDAHRRNGRAEEGGGSAHGHTLQSVLPSRRSLEHMIGAMHANAFSLLSSDSVDAERVAVCTQPVGRGIYPLAAKLNHACRPNATVHYGVSFVLVVLDHPGKSVCSLWKQGAVGARLTLSACV